MIALHYLDSNMCREIYFSLGQINTQEYIFSYGLHSRHSTTKLDYTFLIANSSVLL